MVCAVPEYEAIIPSQPVPKNSDFIERSNESKPRHELSDRSDQCEKSWGAQGLELLAPEYLSSSSMAMLMVRVSMVKTTVMHITFRRHIARIL